MNENSTGANAESNNGGFVLDRSRLFHWALFSLFSALALTGHETDDSNVSANHNTWILCCTSISLSFGILAVVAHVASPAVFVGTWIEGLISLVLVGMWAGCLPVIMDPRYSLGQMYVGNYRGNKDYQATISNANLFFTSWGASITVLSILALYVRGKCGGGMAVVGHTAKWYMLLVASMVCMIEGLRFKSQICELENATEPITCKRNNYGIITSIIGLVISAINSLVSSIGKDSTLVNAVSGFLMVVLYAVCAGLLTYGTGPATYVGNYFFSAWAGFFVSLGIFGGVVQDYLGMSTITQQQQIQSGGGEDADADMEMNRI